MLIVSIITIVLTFLPWALEPQGEKVAYFPDLSAYAYGRGHHPGVVHIGWLDGLHQFPKGHVDSRLIEKLKLLANKPVELYRGKHTCEVCVQPEDVLNGLAANGSTLDFKSRLTKWAEWADERSSNGEIRVAFGGVTYAAPVLIVHYIEEHGYIPPAQFLEAIDKAG
jgi:hypothetical protein